MSIQARRETLDLTPTAGSPAVAQACAIPLVRDPISEAAAAGLAQAFKALADPVRLRLVSLIGAHQGGEVCVCELTDAFDLSQPTISHHLKILREAGIIGSQRRGTWVYYRLEPAALKGMAALLSEPDAGQRGSGHSVPPSASIRQTIAETGTSRTRWPT